MTLSKKKSRLITINTNVYRWVISPNDGYIVLVAHREDVQGQKLEVYVNSEINSFWVEFPYTSNLNLKILNPKDAETIIRQALNLGWNPETKGKPLVFDWKNKELVSRNKFR
ncbi:MAG: hypothetical protein A3D31_08945 [Candidatus Fluviicola riflensis]|nr:MAG: hypothetical protein CHH17_13355 [Candidatus Fluviicola riflensis]OGS77137.1 MAG: hypothetical protein A3D31_08945 [Candidatus Fluviicola riflensis]OGS82072.1 MAG: hypothetical protein A2724_17890 [Fluviicola sp. RIFCSPHIGHO2_01_FULL_43_53]OGS87766.1 MAG: hypothetical protein A3E30_15325 [Fluviicola sp. RIFCSPHIGHO2_12_FULL_43_24]